MPRLVTPFSNPYAHGSHTLTPYSRRQRETISPTNSDKENEEPASQQPGKVLASQAALREKLSEQSNTEYYDPFQPREKVRDVMQSYRQLIQDTTECRADFLKAGNDGIKDTIEKADEIFERDVRTTSVANLDSRLLVTTSDLAKLKARNMTLGDAAFNVDEYIAKLVSFMGGRHQIRGGRVEPSQRERDEDMDWMLLGRTAMGICRRPPTVEFMLGPLSVEKKERKVTRRLAERRDNAEVVRPQELKEGDIQKQENATSVLVRSVAQLLKRHSPINLFEFVINPRSFGQTIENIFYLSFSVRDARAKISVDGNGLPTVSYVDALTESDMMIENKQCILEMTMAQWEELKGLFNITESIIPHREDEMTTTSAQTWY